MWKAYKECPPLSLPVVTRYRPYSENDFKYTYVAQIGTELFYIPLIYDCIYLLIYDCIYLLSVKSCVLVSEKIEMIVSLLCLNYCHKMPATLFSWVGPISFIDIHILPVGLSILFQILYSRYNMLVK